MPNDHSARASNGQAQSDPEQHDHEECFVIAPIEDPRSDTRRRADALLNEAIRPVIEDKIGLDVTAAHERSDAGRITSAVLQHLLTADLVIADLTGLNANVMYELAVRHAKKKPVVPVAGTGTTLPFEMMAERTVFYQKTLYGLDKLKSKLEYAARAALENEEPANPIYRTVQHMEEQAPFEDASSNEESNRSPTEIEQQDEVPQPSQSV